MNDAPHLQDGFDAIIGSVKRRQAKQTAAAAASEMMDRKKSHADAIAKARAEAYTAAMLDFMYASSVMQDKMTMEPEDQTDLNTPLPTMYPMG